MDKNKAKQYLDYLNEKYTEWYINPKLRQKIAADIYNAALHWDDEIYLYLSPGNATGLFKPGFFESDIEKAFKLLDEIVNGDNYKPVNKMYKIYNRLQSYQVPSGDVVRKEMKDYLIEKIQNGELSKGKITFRDEEDFDYFSHLADGVGVDANSILEEIVMSVFPKEE